MSRENVKPGTRSRIAQTTFELDKREIVERNKGLEFPL
jgi:hypothetical protein